MSTANTYRNQPDECGHFGQFGGRYVAETLMPLILDLEREYRAAQVGGRPRRIRLQRAGVVHRGMSL